MDTFTATGLTGEFAVLNVVLVMVLSLAMAVTSGLESSMGKA